MLICMAGCALGSLKLCAESPQILASPGERCHEFPPTAHHIFVNTPPPPKGSLSVSSEESRGDAGGSTGVWHNLTAGASQPFLFLDG